MQLVMSFKNNLLLVIGATVLTLFLCEFGLRVSHLPIVERIKSRQMAQDPMDDDPRGIYQLHPKIGWTLAPNITARYQKSDFDITIVANQDGLRDKKFGPKGPNAYRILGLGDSFAFGWGVQNEQSVLKVLERKLNSEPLSIPHRQSPVANRYEVINSGIPGFGTYEALKLLELIGLQYDPDLVILAFYEGNDYQNNGDAPRDRVIRDGYLKDARPARLQGFTDFMKERSVLWAFIRTAWSNLREKRLFKQNLEKTKEFILEMKFVLDNKKVPLVVVLIPDQDPEFYGRHPILRFYDRLISGMDFFEARKELEVFAGQNGILFYQLSNRFERREEAEKLRFKDTHLNEKGHETAAEEIFNFLKAYFVFKP